MYAYERIDVMQNCCLWIGGVKVSDLDGIRDNFNITDVKGYYLGGRLADWLRLGGYDNEAARIDNIDRNGDVERLLRIYLQALRKNPTAIIKTANTAVIISRR